nr:MAG TPA: hypothetical protein [Caudoviricetes sp.]
MMLATSLCCKCRSSRKAFNLKKNHLKMGHALLTYMPNCHIIQLPAQRGARNEQAGRCA